MGGPPLSLLGSGPGTPKPGQGMDPMRAMTQGLGPDPMAAASPQGLRPPLAPSGLPVGGALPDFDADDPGGQPMGGSGLLQAMLGSLSGDPHGQPPSAPGIPQNESPYRDRAGLYKLVCAGCGGDTIFYKSQMIYPSNMIGPLPIDGMPGDVQSDFQEARRVADASPRSAAALLRLAVQKLCKHLGEKGKRIDDDIGNLVKKGLPVEVQRALDIVRVVGNNAVHPGEIDLNDTPEVCLALFELVNLIVDRMLIGPARLDRLYSALPESNLIAIQKRDGS